MANNKDTVLTKKAHTKEQYTEEQINHLAKCMDPESGYLHFIKNFYWIQHPVKGRIQFDPFPYQERLLHGYHKYRHIISLLSRQCGKCVEKNTKIKVKHKITGEIIELPIGDFFALQQHKVEDNNE